MSMLNEKECGYGNPYGSSRKALTPTYLITIEAKNNKLCIKLKKT